MKDGQKLPQLHTIAYPEKYLPKLHEDGASAFSGKMDHANSRYYVFNDYYNMQSDETLHILTHFETYQQTTEFTCGAACALMVSVPGENKTKIRTEDTYVDMLGSMNLKLETYYAAEKNICIIHIP